jgi:hypothetical protein
MRRYPAADVCANPFPLPPLGSRSQPWPGPASSMTMPNTCRNRPKQQVTRPCLRRSAIPDQSCCRLGLNNPPTVGLHRRTGRSRSDDLRSPSARTLFSERPLIFGREEVDCGTAPVEPDHRQRRSPCHLRGCHGGRNLVPATWWARAAGYLPPLFLGCSVIPSVISVAECETPPGAGSLRFGGDVLAGGFGCCARDRHRDTRIRNGAGRMMGRAALTDGGG